MVNLENPQPFVYSSGRYANEFNKTTVAVPIAPSRNGNVLVYDLRYDLEKLLEEDSEREGLEQEDSERERSFFPIVKELCYNKCPAVAPIRTLDIADGWKKIGLSKEDVQKNWKILASHPEFVEKMRILNEERPEFPEAVEPEQALYDGFLNDADRLKVEAVRNADAEKLADFQPEFQDERLPELLLHYKGRNFPESLSETEMEKWEKYRRARLERQAPRFLAELSQVSDDFIQEELKLYIESLA